MRKQAGRANRMRVRVAVNIEPGTLSFEQLVRCGGQGDTGFVQFLHRWYDAETGKWLRRDPIGVEGGINLYAYTENNPVNRVDVLGLCRETCEEKFNRCTHERSNRVLKNPVFFTKVLFSTDCFSPVFVS